MALDLTIERAQLKARRLLGLTIARVASSGCARTRARERPYAAAAALTLTLRAFTLNGNIGDHDTAAQRAEEEPSAGGLRLL